MISSNEIINTIKGGICGGLKAFLKNNMEIISGSDLILSTTKLEEKIKASSIVFTGEGKIDKSTFQGKVVEKVIRFLELLKHRFYLSRSVFVNLSHFYYLYFISREY